MVEQMLRKVVMQWEWNAIELQVLILTLMGAVCDVVDVHHLGCGIKISRI
jgi:hypothetical protein